MGTLEEWRHCGPAEPQALWLVYAGIQQVDAKVLAPSTVVLSLWVVTPGGVK